MPRETTTLTTPAGKELVIKTYLNAREKNFIKSAFLEGIKLDVEKAVENKSAGVKEVDASIMLLAEKRTIEQMVVSYDKITDGIILRLEDGSPEEYDFVLSEVNKATKSPFPSAK